MDQANTAAAEQTQAQTQQNQTQEKPAEPAIVVPPGHKLMTWFFKTEKVKDPETGEVLDDKPGKKHPDVKAAIPMPTTADLITYLSAADGTKEAKVRDLIMDAVEDTIFLAARGQINAWREENKDANFTPDKFNLDQLSIQAIALMPKGQRGAWAPSDDELKEFNNLYTQVFVHKLNYDPKKTKVHTDHWKSGMAKVKTNKEVVSKLQELLTAFAGNVEEDDLKEVFKTYEWLQGRATKYINAEEKNYLEAL